MNFKLRYILGKLNRIILFLYRLLSTILATLIAPFFILMGWLSGLNDSFIEVAILSSKMPFYFGEKLRYLFYKFTLKQIGSDVTFRYGSFCCYQNTIIGNRALIGYYNSLGEVSIGDDVIFGGFVNVLSGTSQHSFLDANKRIAAQEGGGRRIIFIGSDVWIGSNSIICNDVGNRCVVGAGSVVIHPVEDHSLVVGNPGRLVRKI